MSNAHEDLHAVQADAEARDADAERTDAEREADEAREYDAGIARVREYLEANTWQVYIDRGDGLTNAQVDAYLADDWESLWDDMDEWLSETRSNALYDLLLDAYREAGVERDDVDGDDDMSLRDLASEREHPDADVVRDLANNTNNMLLAWRVTGDDAWDDMADRDSGIASIADAITRTWPNVAPEAAHNTAEALWDQCGGYGFENASLEVVWYGDVTDAPRETGDTLTLTRPILVMLNSWNGSGSDAKLDATVTLTREHSPTIREDSRSYSWTETCGPHLPAYAPDDAVKGTTPVAPATAYVYIERQHGPDLMVEYPTREAAEHALTDSAFIDGLCEEDCLDARVTADAPGEGDEHVIPPTEDEDNAGE